MPSTDAAFNSDADRPSTAHGQPVSARSHGASAGACGARGLTAADWFKQASSISASHAHPLDQKMDAFRARRAASREVATAADWFKQASSINASHADIVDGRMDAFRVRRAASKEAASLDCPEETPSGYGHGSEETPSGYGRRGSGDSTTTAGTTPRQSAFSGFADMRSSRVEVKAGDNNLLERLRSKTAPEVKAGENVSLPVVEVVDFVQQLRRRSRLNTVP